MRSEGSDPAIDVSLQTFREKCSVYVRRGKSFVKRKGGKYILEYGKMDKMDRQERLERTASMAYNKGLINNPGENNCFLNSAVQVSKLPCFQSKLYFPY